MMRLTRVARYLGFAACLSVSTFSVRPVRAADPDELARAREAFDKGLALEAARSWEAALAEYRRVAKVRATPAVRFHIARCLEQLGQWIEAIGAYDLASTDAQGPDRDEILRLSAEAKERLQSSLPSLLIDADSATQGLQLRLDGVEIRAASPGGPRLLDPGRHELEVRDGERRELYAITLAVGEHKTFRLVPPPRDASRKGDDLSRPRNLAPQPGVSHGVGPWLLVSGGAVSVAGALVFWQLAQSKETDLRHACYSPDVCPTSAKSIHDQGERYTLVANIAGGVGLAAAGAGLTWLLWPTKPAPANPESARLNLAVGPARLTLSGRF